MSVHAFPRNAHEAWKRAESLVAAKERQAVQRIGRYPVIELDEPPRKPDGTREFCALLDASPRSTR